MKIDFPSIFEVDINSWEALNWSGCTDQEILEKRALYQKLHDLIRDKPLITRPIGGGLRYIKPVHYLSLALTESGLGWQEVESRVNYACSQKKNWYHSIYRAWRGKRVLENEEVISRRRALMETVKRQSRTLPVP